MDDFNRARSINPGFGKPRFSKTEIKHLLIALLVMALAFTIVLARSNPHYFDDDFWTNALCWFGVSILIALVSFFVHEMGHKFVAQKYGAWSEFRMFPIGLLLCIVTSFLGFLFAAPGAVYIDGNIDKRMNGHIALAGPGMNLILGGIALLISMATTGYVCAIFNLIAYLNGFLAAFNMIPIPPLDGSKIIRWNPFVFVIALALAIVLIVFTRM